MTTIRRAGPDDAVELIGLIRAFYVADGHPFDVDTVTAGLSPLLVDDRFGTVLLTTDDGRAVGYCVLTWGWSIEGGGLEGLVDEIFMIDRGRGHGGALLERAMELASDHGCSRVFLETEAANAAARRFYTRHHFVAEDSVWMIRSLD